MTSNKITEEIIKYKKDKLKGEIERLSQMGGQKYRLMPLRSHLESIELLEKEIEETQKKTAEAILPIIKKRLQRLSTYILEIPEGNHNFSRNSLSGMTYNTYLLLEKELKQTYGVEDK